MYIHSVAESLRLDTDLQARCANQARHKGSSSGCQETHHVIVCSVWSVQEFTAKLPAVVCVGVLSEGQRPDQPLGKKQGLGLKFGFRVLGLSIGVKNFQGLFGTKAF